MRSCRGPHSAVRGLGEEGPCRLQIVLIALACYNQSMSNVVMINSKILGGTPVFMGTRVPAESLFDYLKRGRSIDYFLEQFPTVKREQVETLLDEAKAITLPQRLSA
jgi:uncharacterized protein (DUF433 family)